MKYQSQLFTTLLILFTMLSLCATGPLEAQILQSPSSGRSAFGVFGAVRFNNHAADFRSLPAVPSCCPQYSQGDGTGYAIGFLYDIPLSGMFFLSLRGDYSAYGAELTAIENQPIDVEGQIFNAQIEHGIDAGLTSIGFQPMLGYRLFSRVSLLMGGRLGIVTGSTYDQTEALIEPENMGTFENGLRTRNTGSGDIPDASSLYPTITFGISYALPLSPQGTLELAPEVMYHYGLSPVVSNLDWYAHGIQAGAVLRYTPPAPSVVTPPPPPPPSVPEPPPAPPMLTADISAVSVEADGATSPVINIVVEEFISTNLRPMLPYVFFAEGSSEIDTRYDLLSRGEATSFDVDALHEASTLEVYYDLLNVIGSRMREQPTAQITITGCNDATGEERSNTTLSRDRAETVKNYLTSVWNIDPGRIRLRARDLPALPSRTSDPDGQAENRRVEISCSDPAILAPILTHGVERQITPPAVRFIPKVTAEAGIRDWSLTLRAEDDVLFERSGTGNPQTVEWKIRDELEKTTGARNRALTYQLLVNDATGQQRRSADKSIPVNMITIQTKNENASLTDREIARYSLILFDYDKADLSPANETIASMIRKEITSASTVTITGYSDRIGEEAYNRELSLQRAQAAARAVRANNASVNGKGEDVLRYDNNLPEGRFFSRTVDIIVETPVSH